MSDVTIRPETEEDVDAVLDVLMAVAAEERWIGTQLPLDRSARLAQMHDKLKQSESFAGFVAEVDGTVVGSIGLELAPYGVVDLGICLLDGYRSQGIGVRLMQRGIEWARHAGAHKMTLQVWPHNERGIGLYRKLGFVEEGRLRRHYRRNSGEIWDSVIMGLPLEEDPPATR